MTQVTYQNQVLLEVKSLKKYFPSGAVLAKGRARSACRRLDFYITRRDAIARGRVALRKTTSLALHLAGD